MATKRYTLEYNKSFSVMAHWIGLAILGLVLVWATPVWLIPQAGVTWFLCTFGGVNLLTVLLISYQKDQDRFELVNEIFEQVVKKTPDDHEHALTVRLAQLRSMLQDLFGKLSLLLSLGIVLSALASVTGAVIASIFLTTLMIALDEWGRHLKVHEQSPDPEPESPESAE